MSVLRLLFVLALTSALAACASRPTGPVGGKYKVGAPYKVAGRWYHPREQPNYDETGIASWYGPGFHGQRTADGEIFDKNSLSAAHTTLPMPVNVRVTNLSNGRSLVLRVNDRGPFVSGRIIDVSERAAELLGFKRQGTARVRVQFIGRSGQDQFTMVASGKPQRNKADTSAAQSRSAPVPIVETATLEPEATKASPSTPVTASALRTTSQEPASAQPAAGRGATARTSGDSPTAPAAAASRQAESTAKSLLSLQAAYVLGHVFVQAGAFSDAHNAYTLYNQVIGLGKVTISPIEMDGQRVYRVRLGPVADEVEANRLTAELKARGHDAAQIIVE